MAARMPTWDRLIREWPVARLEASGEAVGLPAGQMGNSEVGHLNLGAGFRVLQDLPRITLAIADGTFRHTPALVEACRTAVRRGSSLHLMGLVGPGGVHAIDEHIVATAELAADEGIPAERVFLHAFTDGRDTPPRSADRFLPELVGRLAGRLTPATVIGRYFAMDRDGRWDRTRLAYDAIVHAMGERAPAASSAIVAAYARGEADEFIRPTVLDGYPGVADGDVLVHLNFRADRARQLTRALALDTFGTNPRDLHVATLTEYQTRKDLPVSVAFRPLEVDSLAAYLSRLGKRQLHVAET